MISIAGLRELTQRLSDMDLAGARASGLARAADAVERSVRENLSMAAGDEAGNHDLAGSIGAAIEADRAVIGSSAPAAADVELGSRAAAPRSFLAETARAAEDDVADMVAAGVVEALRGR